MTALIGTRSSGGGRYAAGFALAILLGFLLAASPVVVLAYTAAACAFTLLAILFLRCCSSQTRLWHALVLTALTGYIVLNYGFANLAFRVAGVPMIIGHTLMFGALGLVLFSTPRVLLRASSELPALSLLALLLIALLHLCFNVSQYGWYAVRDSSMFLEGIFFPLGIAWGIESENIASLMKWLMFLFVANLAYSWSFPWAETLQAWSPKSGIFLVSPVLGFYAHNYLYLLAGALFCLWLGHYVPGWPRWCLILLAIGQLFELAVHQARSMYVGVVVVLLLLALLREFRNLAKIGAALAAAALLLLLLTPLAGVQLEGRVGPVSAAFLEEHVRSLFFVPGTPAVGTLYSREEWNREIWQRIQSSTANILLGEGFGKPLINFEEYTGAEVRQPHDTHLTVLARLGILGLIFWVMFHFSITWRFFRALSDRQASTKFHEVVLWFLAFYVMSLLVTTVEPLLDFSYGAIPFYLLTGFVIGVIRRHSSECPW